MCKHGYWHSSPTLSSRKTVPTAGCFCRSLTYLNPIDTDIFDFPYTLPGKLSCEGVFCAPSLSNRGTTDGQPVREVPLSLPPRERRCGRQAP